MEIGEEAFWARTDQARSPHLWRRENGKWELWQELPELREKLNGDGLPHSEEVA
jgi:hypothetical protein